MCFVPRPDFCAAAFIFISSQPATVVCSNVLCTYTCVLCCTVPASELSMAQLSHWAGRYSDTLTQQTYHIELREDEFEDIVVLEISGRDTEPIDEWTGTGKVGHSFIHR